MGEEVQQGVGALQRCVGEGGRELRMVTLNVHGWKDRCRRSNTRRVAALLRRLRPHVLCLQEVQDRPRWLADDFGGDEDPKSTDLSLFRSVFAAPFQAEDDQEEDGWAWEWEWMSIADWGGSLIASRLPVTRRYRHRLSTADGADERPLVGMRMKLGEGATEQVDVFCVHLDHRMESKRKEQAEAILAYMHANECLPHHVLLGDFNAISREDYTTEGWESLRALRAASRWEEPLAEVTDLLKQRGYHDVPFTAFIVPASDEEEEEEEDDDDEEEDDDLDVHTERWTCWAGTRVDYAWISSAAKDRVTGEIELVAVHHSLRYSDHRPLLLSLRF